MNISGVDIAMINQSIDQLRDDTSNDISLIAEKIEELRKDLNYYDQQINSRVNSTHKYFSEHIARLDFKIAEKDTEIKQLKEKINLLSDEISLIWDRLDKKG